MLKFMIEGGEFMWVILAVSIVAMAITIERFYALMSSYAPDSSFFSRLIHTIKEGKLDSAAQSCYRTSHPLARVIASLIKHKGEEKSVLESKATVSLQKIFPEIQKRTPYLGTIANVATLLGLLGTIQGLIVSFASLANASAEAKAELLAKGISTAMNTTALGLAVAIPTIICFAVLSVKETRILQKYEEVVNEVIHILSHDLSSGEHLSLVKKSKAS